MSSQWGEKDAIVDSEQILIRFTDICSRNDSFKCIY